MIFKSQVDGITIDYSIYKAEKEKIRMLFLTGRAEYYRKYESLFYLLNEQGVTVYTMDHRGQGHSGRMLGNKLVGHVEKFSHFVDDAEFFLKNLVMKDDMEVLSLSHSMGGAVSLLLGMRDSYFSKMIFTSPMWGINTGKIGKKAAFLLSSIFCRLGKGDSFVPGTGPDYLSGMFENNILTHSRKKFEAQKEYLKLHPEAALGGPSNKWLYESLKMCSDLEKIDITLNSKVLLLQARGEMVVDNKAQNRILKRIENSKKIEVNDAFHELLNESWEIFEKVLSEIILFIEK